MREYPSEFTSTPSNELYCKFCDCLVTCDRAIFVKSHRETAKHRLNSRQSTPSSASTMGPTSRQTFLAPTSDDMSSKIVHAFLSANIPLHKLRNQHLNDLFTELGQPLPSESFCRQKVNEIYEKERKRIIEMISGKSFFLVVDESDVSNTKYLNILVGKLSDPTKAYLLTSEVLDSAPNSATVLRLVDDAISSLQCDRGHFCLLLTDAARYMTAVADNLRNLYPMLFHVTCLAHLMHNCAIRIKAHYDLVDQLIARVKATTVKNKRRANLFTEIGVPPHPVVTRWGSWLQAALYYAKHLPTVRSIVNSFKKDGLLVATAQEIIKNPAIPQQLLEIQENYESLVQIIPQLESTSCTIKSAFELVRNLNLRKDPCKILEYIEKRLKSNGIASIMAMDRNEVSPQLYCLLQRAQPSTASVERSFSMLKKLLSKDRNFQPENVKKYLMVYFNNAQS